MVEELGVLVEAVDFHERNALSTSEVTLPEEVRHRFRECSCGT